MSISTLFFDKYPNHTSEVVTQDYANTQLLTSATTNCVVVNLAQYNKSTSYVRDVFFLYTLNTNLLRIQAGKQEVYLGCNKYNSKRRRKN